MPKFIAVCWLTLLAAFSAFADDAQLEAVRERLAQKFDVIAPEDVNPGPIDGWYQIQKGPIVAYVSADGRYLIQGDLIDIDAGVNLTETARNSVRKDALAALDSDQFITFSPDDVQHSVTVFTDIDCSYCRKLHSQIEEYLDLGIEVRYMLYPRNGPASRSWTTSENVWCASDRNAALTSAKLDRSFESHQCDSSTITKHFSVGQDIGVTGTPAIILDDGTLVSGYLPPQALTARLKSHAAASVASK